MASFMRPGSKAGLQPLPESRDLWADLAEHSDLHVDQGGTGSSLPFSAETVQVEQEERHSQMEVLEPAMTRDNIRADLDQEDRTLEHDRLLAEQQAFDTERHHDAPQERKRRR